MWTMECGIACTEHTRANPTLGRQAAGSRQTGGGGGLALPRLLVKAVGGGSEGAGGGIPGQPDCLSAAGNGISSMGDRQGSSYVAMEVLLCVRIPPIELDTEDKGPRSRLLRMNDEGNVFTFSITFKMGFGDLNYSTKRQID